MDDLNEKVREILLRWYGYVTRMEEANLVKKVMNKKIKGTRARGRPWNRWKDDVKKDMDHFQVRAEDTEDRHLWRRKIRGNQASEREREKGKEYLAIQKLCI